MRRVVLALLLLLPSGLALAEGCHDDAKMSCAEGTTWDAEKATCVAKPSA